MKPLHILARKKARTKLYAMLYGACTSNVPHNNMPWIDSNRRGHNLPDGSEFKSLVHAAKFNPVQLSRVVSRFVKLGGDMNMAKSL